MLFVQVYSASWFDGGGLQEKQACVYVPVFNDCIPAFLMSSAI